MTFCHLTSPFLILSCLCAECASASDAEVHHPVNKAVSLFRTEVLLVKASHHRVNLPAIFRSRHTILLPEAQYILFHALCLHTIIPLFDSFTNLSVIIIQDVVEESSLRSTDSTYKILTLMYLLCPNNVSILQCGNPLQKSAD